MIYDAVRRLLFQAPPERIHTLVFGALRGAKLMTQLAGGTIAPGIIDYYPNPADTVTVDLPQSEVTRLVGIELSVEDIKQILESLEFQVEITDSQSPNPSASLRASLQSPISNLQPSTSPYPTTVSTSPPNL